MFLKKIAIAGAAVGLMGSAAFAGGHANCGPDGQSIRVLGSDFPAIQAVTAEAQEACGGSSSEFTITLRDDTRDMMNQAQTPNPAQYTSVVVANSSLTQLMNDGLVRPLDDLIEKYGQNISKNQMITIGGNVMAVAFMANSQHLYARTDILEQVGITELPTTVDEVVAAAEAIRAAGIMEHPIALNASGWNQGELFNLFFFAAGGQFFESGTANPSVNNENGVAALEAIAKLAEYAHPDYLSHASNETQGLWEAGQAALGIMWGSRGGAILDDEGSSPEVTENTVLAAAPTLDGGEIPAATLWWDGFTIATNISDVEAEATFAALASALSPEMVAEHNDDAIWLLDGYKPGPAAEGVSATARAGARPYPMIPYMNFMHNAASAEVPDFLKGDQSAEETLADIEAAYRDAAKEAGFLE
ncbi:MAG: extracellular solute-binding protein [Paracoccaceae bacterium]|nr:extracellular solute-binding protein [Paracoccaceae bacterium]